MNETKDRIERLRIEVAALIGDHYVPDVSSALSRYEDKQNRKLNEIELNEYIMKGKRFVDTQEDTNEGWKNGSSDYRREAILEYLNT